MYFFNQLIINAVYYSKPQHEFIYQKKKKFDFYEIFDGATYKGGKELDFPQNIKKRRKKIVSLLNLD